MIVGVGGVVEGASAGVATHATTLVLVHIYQLGAMRYKVFIAQ